MNSPLNEAYSGPALSVHSAIPGITAAGPKEQEASIGLEVGFEKKHGALSLNLNGAQLPLEDALRVKAAEFWLKLGEADEALRELGKLPSRS